MLWMKQIRPNNLQKTINSEPTDLRPSIVVSIRKSGKAELVCIVKMLLCILCLKD